jgi:hypothetical protein
MRLSHRGPVHYIANVDFVGSNPINRSMIQILYVFAAAFVLGFVYSFYIRRTALATKLNERAIAASSGSILYVLGAVVVISYVGNPLMLVPAVIGDWLGSFLQMTLDRHKHL